MQALKAVQSLAALASKCEVIPQALVNLSSKQSGKCSLIKTTGSSSASKGGRVVEATLHCSIPSLALHDGLRSQSGKFQLPRCMGFMEQELELAEDSEKEDSTVAEAAASVKVRFVLQREVLFGQEFVLVGGADFLGNWNLECACPLTWSDGHLWTIELEVPTDTVVEYKLVLIGKRGELEWQPGPNRSLDATTASADSPMELIVMWDIADTPSIGETVSENVDEMEGLSDSVVDEGAMVFESSPHTEENKAATASEEVAVAPSQIQEQLDIGNGRGENGAVADVSAVEDSQTVDLPIEVEAEAESVVEAMLTAAFSDELKDDSVAEYYDKEAGFVGTAAD